MLHATLPLSRDMVSCENWSYSKGTFIWHFYGFFFWLECIYLGLNRNYFWFFNFKMLLQFEVLIRFKPSLLGDSRNKTKKCKTSVVKLKAKFFFEVIFKKFHISWSYTFKDTSALMKKKRSHRKSYCYTIL
jgi:hypothetical protein